MKKDVAVGILILLTLVAGMCAGFCFGFHYGQAGVEPQVVTDTKFIEIEKPVLTERLRVVAKPVIVEKIVIKEVLPEWWADYAKYDFIPFESKNEIWKYVQSTSIPNREYVEKDYDCDDFAIDLAIQAMKDRRPIGLFLILDRDEEKLHLKNFAIRGNHILEVSPWTGFVQLLEGYDARLD